MKAKKLTIARARDLPFEDLVEAADALVEEYGPTEPENAGQRLARLERTLDEVPEIYRWFLTLESYFDHWTDAYADQSGMRSRDYKRMRERRDAMERVAKAAKMRYDGASRLVTVLQGFDAHGTPTARRAD